MCLKEKRKLTIPAHMAYGQDPHRLVQQQPLIYLPMFLGPRGFGEIIPPNSALVFTVELVGLDTVVREEL